MKFDNHKIVKIRLMIEFIVAIGVISVLAFILHGFEKNRIMSGKSEYPTAMMIVAGVLAPFGSLMGMLLFGNRMKHRLMVIIVPVMLVLFLLFVYLFRSELN